MRRLQDIPLMRYGFVNILMIYVGHLCDKLPSQLFVRYSCLVQRVRILVLYIISLQGETIIGVAKIISAIYISYIYKQLVCLCVQYFSLYRHIYIYIYIYACVYVCINIKLNYMFINGYTLWYYNNGMKYPRAPLTFRIPYSFGV